MSQSGLATWMGNAISGAGALPQVAIVLLVTTLFVFLTEVTSNTATATMAMPIMVGIGGAVGVPPLLLMTAAALSASMAFMLPVATPPNAIVFASGYLTIPHMIRAGFWVNALAIALITLFGVPLFALVFLT